MKVVRRTTQPIIFSILCACLLIQAPGLSAQSNSITPPSFVPNELLVQFKESASDAERASIQKRFSLSELAFLSEIRTGYYSFPTDINSRALIEGLRREAKVETVELNALTPLNALPRDPLVGDQWALDDDGQTINGRRGVGNLDIELGDALETYQAISGVIVAVIDSGVALDHPDINPKVWGNAKEVFGTDGVDDDENGYVDDYFGWDFVDGGGIPLDENGHGTQAAGLIAARQNDGIGISGIAPHAQIMSLRVADDFGSFGFPLVSLARTLLAIEYAVKNGARVINASYGGTSQSSIMSEQLEWVDENGVLFVAAAGNGGSDLFSDNNDELPVYPSSYPSEAIISVAAIDRDGKLASFSNFGPASVDVAAPGVDILSTSVTRSGFYLETFDFGAEGWTVGTGTGNLSPDSWALWNDGTGNRWITDSVDINFQQKPYESNTNIYAQSPTFDFRGISGPQLTFDALYELEFLFDIFVVEGSADGINWDLLFFRTGSLLSGLDAKIALDVSRYEGGDATFRFRILTNNQVNFDGVAIDNVAITKVDTFAYDGRQFDMVDGTSFAAPLVTGAAALIMSAKPDLTHRQVKSLILSNGKPLSSLANRLTSGSTLDVSKALNAALTPNPDSDGDGVPDSQDAFPLDPTETVDTDQDGTGDVADLDDDNDGNSDGIDPAPTGDQPDSDGDGVPDSQDAFPLDPTETVDTDGDGIGDFADPDDDNDGNSDGIDPYPKGNDPDRDGDGVIDAADFFPDNPAESKDTDRDGIGDNEDQDDDADGFNDTIDAFPLNQREWLDTDGDGIGNNEDQDDDGDFVLDSDDAFPLDPSRSAQAIDGEATSDNQAGSEGDADTEENESPNDSAIDRDTDQDGFTDEEEMNAGTNPNDATDFPISGISPIVLFKALEAKRTEEQ